MKGGCVTTALCCACITISVMLLVAATVGR